MAILHELLSSIRIEIADRGAELWQNDELIRAVEKTVSLMSRLLPRKGMVSGKIQEEWIAGNYLDVSELLPVSSRLGDAIQRVEYPAGRTPPELIPVEVMGNYLWLKTNVPLRAGEDIRIVYQGVWSAPTLMEPGNYPPHLDNIVVIGAAGQALIFRAEYLTHKAVASLEGAQAIIDDLISVTFPDPPDYTDVEGELYNLLDKAKVTLAKAQDAFGVALATAVGMNDPLTTGADNASSRISCYPHAAANARAYLDTGEPLINAVTVGERVGDLFGQYARTEVDIGKEYVNSGLAYIQLAHAIEAKAGRENTVANGYVYEATQHLEAFGKILRAFDSEVTLNTNMVNMYRAQLEAMTQDANLSTRYLEAAGRYLASGQSKINEMLASLGYKPELFKSMTSSELRD